MSSPRNTSWRRLYRLLAEASPDQESRVIEREVEALIRESKDHLTKPKDDVRPSTPRRPGARKERINRARGRLRAINVLEHPHWSAEEIAAETEAQLFQLQALGHEDAVSEYEKLVCPHPCPDRRHVYEEVEIRAMRKLEPIRELEAQLTTCREGRPSCRSLALAIFEMMVFAGGRPDVRMLWKAFHKKTPVLEWAFDSPPTRAPSSVYEALKGMLERNNPKALLEANAEVVRMLSKMDGFEGLGDSAGIDGTFMAVAREQRQGYGQEENLIRNGLDATYGTHRGREHGQGVAGRGYAPLPIWDLKAIVPLAWVAEPFSIHEHLAAPAALDLLFELHPDLLVEYLVGDSAFDKEPFCDQLVFRDGIHPVFARHGSIGADVPHRDTGGVPHCSKHGLMKRLQADDFFTAKQRLANGRRTGQLTRAETSARIRWGCQAAGCDARAYTRPSDNSRLYTFVPFAGDHRLYAKRLALMTRRNVVECGNFMFKHRGVGGRGVEVPRWVQSSRQKEWLVGGALLAITLRRYIHVSGLYEEALSEALRAGLFKEGAVRGKALPEEFREAA